LTARRRYAALRGKITPTSRGRFESARIGGTVGPAHGRAREGVTGVDEVDQSTEPAAEHELATEVSERIRTIIASAEAAANAVRHEAEQRAQVKRRVAEEEARRIVDEARCDAEAYLAERVRRISELSDAVVERGEGIVIRLERAEEVRRQLQGLADALGESADKLADELGSEAGVERRAKPEEVAEEAGEPEASEPEPSEPEAASGDDVEVETAEIADDPTVGELAEEAAEPEASAVATEAPAEAEAPAAEAPAVSREPDEQLSARLVALQMAVAGGKRDEIESHLRRTFELGDVDSILDDVFGNGDDGEGSVAPSRQGDGAA
jgi:hypothetical protein